MIEINEALHIHQTLIDQFGGIKGLRDMGLLEAALQHPYSTFDDTDLYPTPSSKAAAMLESIVRNHPSLDGNRRF